MLERRYISMDRYYAEFYSYGTKEDPIREIRGIFCHYQVSKFEFIDELSECWVGYYPKEENFTRICMGYKTNINIHYPEAKFPDGSPITPIDTKWIKQIWKEEI